MKPHKRNGKEAKARRQTSAKARAETVQEWIELYESLTDTERLLLAIFGKPLTVEEMRRVKTS